MARINIPAGDAPESHRLMAVEENFGTAMATTAMAIYEQSSLDKRVREAVRMRIAIINQCQICLAYRFDELSELGIDEQFYAEISDWQNSAIFSEREKIALEYCERFILQHLAIDDELFQRLRAHFSDEEIYSLSSTIAYLLANGRIMQVLQVEQSCSMA